MPTTCTTTRAKELIAEHLPDLCTIYAPPVASASDKGEEPESDYPDDWTEFAADVVCRIQERLFISSEGVSDDQIKSIKSYNVLVPAATSRPSAKYRIRITSQSNRDLEITHPVKTTDQLVMKIECIEIFVNGA